VASENVLTKSFKPPNMSKIRLEVVVVDSQDVEVAGLRKFLHISQIESKVEALVPELNEKLQRLYLPVDA
jgi:hypothetical protein